MGRLPVARRRGRVRKTVPRPRRAGILAGMLCGLGATLFPGLALLTAQVCIALAWTLLASSLVVGGLRSPGGQAPGARRDTRPHTGASV